MTAQEAIKLANFSNRLKRIKGDINDAIVAAAERGYYDVKLYSYPASGHKDYQLDVQENDRKEVKEYFTSQGYNVEFGDEPEPYMQFDWSSAIKRKPDLSDIVVEKK